MHTRGSVSGWLFELGVKKLEEVRGWKEQNELGEDEAKWEI